MSFITLGNGRRIGDYLKPYIVAELNTSHFGNMEIAKSMIDQAQAAGCDCVKFQSWSAETLYCDSYYQDNKMARRMVAKFSLSDAQLLELAEYAGRIGIDFASTPYSIEEARFLVDQCKVPFIKIASMELNHTPYLKDLGRLQVPLVLSTGMGTAQEIHAAVQAIQSTGNDKIVILHCTSVYPSPPGIIRLQNIAGLRADFPLYPIGYSDHSLGMAIPVASVALGACLIEKHFTLDSSRIGMDNQMATEPEDMRAMIAACHQVHESMGGAARILCDEELGQIGKMRRSIVAKVDIDQGAEITQNHVEFKRPGTGLPPSDLPMVLGKRVGRPIQKGALICLDDLSAQL